MRAACLLVFALALPARAGEADPAHVAALSDCAAAHLPDLPAAERACVGIVSEPCMARPEGQTTLGMNACLAAESLAWDVLLNADWPKLLEGLRRLDAANEVAAMELPSAAALLRRAQRAWLAWREAECAQRRAEWGSGTLGSNIASACWLEMTARRTLGLRARLAELPE